MSRSTSPFRQADVARAVKAVRSAKIDVTGVEIAPDGTIRVLTAAAPQPSSSPFDTWKTTRDARSN